MNFNLTSRIVTNILFDDFESALKNIFSAENVAISPISYSSQKTIVIDHFLSIKSSKHQFIIAVHIDSTHNNYSTAFNEYLQQSTLHVQQILSIVFNCTIHTQYISNRNKVDISQAKRIVFSVQSQASEIYLTLYIPNSFFTLFLGTIKSDTTLATIENAITQYFKNPAWTIPKLDAILQSLNTIELNRMLNQLLQQNLLSIYQLYLLTIAYPDLSLKLKQSLSKNRIQDILDFKRIHPNLEITDRDLAGGIYSIQEAIFFLLKKEPHISYSRFLNSMKILVTNIINMEQLLTKNFESWITEMIQNKLLYKTLALSSDQTIADAIAYQPDKFITIFTKFISDIKIKDIVQLINNKSYTTMTAAQISIIQNYKKSKFEKLKPSPESLGFLLQHFNRKDQYNHLLLSVGWFTLSTALKDINKNSIELLLENIPQAAYYLIEDVLKGVVNPDIIQDDMQMTKAKKECVKTIITLYEEGYIELEI